MAKIILGAILATVAFYGLDHVHHHPKQATACVELYGDTRKC